MSLTSWKYKAGIEMTFQKKVRSIRALENWTNWMTGTRAAEIAYFHACGFRNTSSDPDCIECRTPILCSWETAMKEVAERLKIAKELNLTAKNKNISTGGQGHIHVSGMSTLVKIAIIRDMQNRPYIPWFFADPDTTTSCSSANVDALAEDFPWARKWEEIIKRPSRYCDNFEKFIHTNINSIYKTVEFRFFDCFMNWQQYEESLAFAQAYCKWIAKRVSLGQKFVIKIKTNKDVLKQYNHYERCLEEFKTLIKDIGLPWERYEKYVANLNERFTDERLLT